MVRTKHLVRSFAGGELSPELLGHVELPNYQNGSLQMRNFICKPSGSAFNRPGTRFVKEVKDSTKKTRLAEFEFSIDETLILEVGAGYFRFIAAGAHVTAAPAAFITAKLVSVVDNTTDSFDTSVAHLMTTGQEVMFSSNATVLPTGYAFNTVYFAIVVDSNTLKVAATYADATAATPVPVSISDNLGAGAFLVCRVYRQGDLVVSGGTNYYCQWDSFAGKAPGAAAAQNCSVAAATNLVTTAAHGISSGAQVTFALNGGTLPPEIVVGERYFTLGDTANTFFITDELGGGAIDLTVNSTGTPQWTLANPWYAMPADGTFEIPNSYAEADLFELTIFQSNDVMTFLHRDYPAQELRRYGATQWTFNLVTWRPTADVPTGLQVAANRGQGISLRLLTAATPTVITSGIPATADSEHGLLADDILYLDLNGGVLGSLAAGFYAVSTIPSTITFTLKTIASGARVPSASATLTGDPRFYKVDLATDETQEYVITAVDSFGGETEPTDAVSVSNNLSNRGSFNTLTWLASTDVKQYKVYRKRAGLFGLIGTIEAQEYTTEMGLSGVIPPTETFVDRDDQEPDLGATPPIADDEITVDYPQAGCYFEGRRMVGGTDEHAARIYGTRTGTESDMSYHLPVVETDRLQFDVTARSQNAVRHLVPLAQLVALTNGGEFRISPINTDALAPGSIAPRPQTYVGADYAKPQVVNNIVVFVGNRDKHIYEMGFSQESGAFRTGDLSVYAAHLFDRYGVVQSAQMRSPLPVLWFVSTSGQLLGLTYMPEQQVGGWHVHDAGGTDVFESVACVSESGEDRLYVVVKRTINGSTKRYVERFDTLLRPSSRPNWMFLDCAKTTTTPGATITGLSHLEGRSVVPFVDGVAQAARTVSGGQITVSPAVVSKAHVGLSYTSTLKPLPPVIPMQDAGRSVTKTVTQASVDVFESCSFTLGQTASSQVAPVELNTTTALTTRCRIPPNAGWGDDGTVVILQTAPLPVTIVSLALTIEVGG